MSRSPSGSLRPSVACRRSATQAPPVWMPTMALAGPMRLRSSAASCAQSASASGSAAMEILLEDQLRSDRVDGPALGAAQPAFCLRRRVALVHGLHRQAKTARELAREAPHALGEHVLAALGDPPPDPPRGPPPSLHDTLA